MSKCAGCGVKLQTEFSEQEGYTLKEENQLCQRCFQIQNYNQYKKSYKRNEDYFPILKKINSTKELVLVVIDLFHTIPLKKLGECISNDKIVVLTKRDLLPYSLYEQKLISYFNRQLKNVKDTIVISSNNNYHYDELYEAIMKYKTSDIVYVVGYTNSGKSTMINHLIYHYGKRNVQITTSNLPSTTLNTIDIDWRDDCKLIDTPGLLEEDSIILSLENNDLKKVIPKKEIKPKIYQIKQDTYFKLESFLRISIFKKGTIVFYFSNALLLERLFKEPKDLKDYQEVDITVKKDQDLVITGMGFIKFKEAMNIKLYLKDNIKYYIRNSYI